MEKFLVLGGNGYLGKYIVEKLAINGNNIVVADYNIDGCVDTENIKYKKINFVTCDSFEDYLNEIDTVIHLISTITPNDNMLDINKEIADNVFPTVKLLNDMVKLGTKKIVFVSSGGTVYGEHSIIPISEEEPNNPICNYGIIKCLIEKYLRLYYTNKNLDYRVVRLANPYSEKVKNGKKQGIIPIVIDQIINSQTIKIWGDGEDVRDYIYIDDAIDAIVSIINYTGSEKTFNVGTGIGYSINELLEIISDHMLDYPINIEYLSKRSCDVKNNVLDITKIKKETGWYPKISLEQGIKKVISSKKKSRG